MFCYAPMYRRYYNFIPGESWNNDRTAPSKSWNQRAAIALNSPSLHPN